MGIINTIIDTLNYYLWSYILIILLAGIGLYFSFRTGFVQITKFTEQFKLLTDGGANKEAKKTGGISSFQAFCISTASRVGTGNIAGIALAITAGGPGAVFWMWLMAIVGSASAFVEATLAQIYKVKNGTATKGGPAFYMEQGLGKRWMGVIFAILITLTYAFVFNSVQSNTMSLAFNNAFNVNRMVMACILAALTAWVIFGGVHRVAKVSEIIVPIFAGLYILVAIFITIINIGEVPGILRDIVVGAFNPREFVTGTGVGIMTTLLTGVKRGMFSNEAGMGSAPNAAATAKVSHPVKQGLIQSLGVFTDTIVICSCTAFMLLLFKGYAGAGKEGIELAQVALVYHIGEFGAIFIAVSIFLFAFSSIVGNYYYGEANIEFLSESKGFMFVFRILVVCMVFLGAIAELQTVWNLADVFMAFMSIQNLIVIAILGKYAFAALKDYNRQKQAGISNPVFYVDDIPELRDVEYWHKDSEAV